MLSSSLDRVPANTPPNVNERIRRRTEENVARYAGASPVDVQTRLDQLAEEWDIERALEATAAAFTLAGVGLAARDRRWLAAPAVVAGFLLQHALQGWCPPLAVFRRLGFRTAHEIDAERYALKALRGDLREIGVERVDPRRLVDALA